MIIGLVGKARSGKDTFASILYEKMDRRDILFLTYAYAGKLKETAAEAFKLDVEQTNGSLKEVPDPRYPKREGGFWTPREILQHIGESYRMVDQYYWTESLMDDIDSFTDRKDGDRFNFIITDCRHPDEVRAIEDRNGIIIRITRENRDLITNSNHISETALDNYKFRNVIEVDNSGSRKNLYNEVDRVIELLNFKKLKTVSGGN
jgi:hypothetical protein